jgi:hypothetical protein
MRYADTHVSPNARVLLLLKKKKAHVREGVLPRLLREILSARVAVKKLMKARPPFAPVFLLLYQ